MEKLLSDDIKNKPPPKLPMIATEWISFKWIIFGTKLNCCSVENVFILKMGRCNKLRIKKNYNEILMEFLCETISKFNYSTEKWKLCLFNPFHIWRCCVICIPMMIWLCIPIRSRVVLLRENFYFAQTKDKNEYVCIENKLNGRKTVFLKYIVINVFLDVAIRADRLFRITR